MGKDVFIDRKARKLYVDTLQRLVNGSLTHDKMVTVTDDKYVDPANFLKLVKPGSNINKIEATFRSVFDELGEKLAPFAASYLLERVGKESMSSFNKDDWDLFGLRDVLREYERLPK